MKISTSIFLIGLSLGCTTTKLEFITDFPVISMKRSNIPAGTMLWRYKAVREKWCEGDSREGGEDVDKLGFLDQVVYKAHASTQADYITDARLYWIEKDCILLKGYATRLVMRPPGRPTSSRR